MKLEEEPSLENRIKIVSLEQLTSQPAKLIINEYENYFKSYYRFWFPIYFICFAASVWLAGCVYTFSWIWSLYLVFIPCAAVTLWALFDCMFHLSNSKLSAQKYFLDKCLTRIE